jgi:hypothetical protein
MLLKFAMNEDCQVMLLGHKGLAGTKLGVGPHVRTTGTQVKDVAIVQRG